ncbi:MAG: RNA-binding transcriptional accessory protein [Bacteroidales bacterium]|nr:RNA-binding transcriptional accessory protein [Bacteroidales bacterium]
MTDYATTIATRLGLGVRQVEKTIELLKNGATVPFIARYRKEATGNLNEVQIAAIRDLVAKLQELDKRREAILASISEQGKLTPELEKQILDADNLTTLEDLYLPYKPKRKTRASVAVEKGLEPLAEKILLQQNIDIQQFAKTFVNPEKGVNNTDEALAGAADIIAERISEDATARNAMRKFFGSHAMITSKVVKDKADEGAKFKSWFDWSEGVDKIPSHRILAMFRGENEGVLRVKIAPKNEEWAAERLDRLFVKGRNESSKIVYNAVRDSYKRLLSPSIETEFYNQLKARADQEAIKVFAENLRQLLLASPLGQKRVMAIDPGFRTGCKVVCLNEQGDLEHNETIYPFGSVRDERDATKRIEDLTEGFEIEAIAIGNGTAGRETEEIVRNAQFKNKVIIVMVSENGASVYSASDVAREEFPDYDVTVRGAVSIGRRLMDPLSELVKIDPKSIGVGQYQHDVDHTLLQQSLNDVVESCVNSVGVELNTASKELLSYVSGIGPALAKNIVAYRNRNGAFASRRELLKVERLGEKAFEQCAGFLRIRESENPLDRSAVHPERYALVEKMAKKVGASVEQLMADKSLRAKININDFVGDDCGLPTLQDIMKELDKPGLDPRTKFEVFEFDNTINTIDDLRPGMVLPGIVTNITAFGAFVDVGIHNDGLLHVSQMGDRYVKDPNQVVKIHQHLKVKVLDVDTHRKRISFTLKGL